MYPDSNVMRRRSGGGEHREQIPIAVEEVEDFRVDDGFQSALVEFVVDPERVRGIGLASVANENLVSRFPDNAGHRLFILVQYFGE